MTSLALKPFDGLCIRVKASLIFFDATTRLDVGMKSKMTNFVITFKSWLREVKSVVRLQIDGYISSVYWHNLPLIRLDYVRNFTRLRSCWLAMEHFDAGFLSLIKFKENFQPKPRQIVCKIRNQIETKGKLWVFSLDISLPLNYNQRKSYEFWRGISIFMPGSWYFVKRWVSINVLMFKMHHAVESCFHGSLKPAVYFRWRKTFSNAERQHFSFIWNMNGCQHTNRTIPTLLINQVVVKKFWNFEFEFHKQNKNRKKCKTKNFCCCFLVLNVVKVFVIKMTLQMRNYFRLELVDSFEN